MGRTVRTRSSGATTTTKRKSVAKVEDADDEHFIDDGKPIHLLVMKGLPSLDCKRGTPKKGSALELDSVDMLKEEPSLWVRLNDVDKFKALKRLYGDGPYFCFSIKGENDEPCTSFSTMSDAVSHCNRCIKPMYMTFLNGRSSVFRALDPKLKSRYIKEGLHAIRDLPCLSCSRTFSHHYGLQYHLDRCNVEEKERPWKCYKCGFCTTQDQSDLHLNFCGLSHEEIQIKKEFDELYENNDIVRKEVLIALDAHRTDRNDSLEDANGQPSTSKEFQTPDDVATQKALSIILKTPESATRMGRRRKPPVSLSAGYIPPESSRVRVSTSGALRFRFRKSEITSNPPCISDWVRYTDFVSKSASYSDSDKGKGELCDALKNINDVWTDKLENPSYYLDTSKTSVSFKNVSPNAAATSEDCIPPGAKRLKLFETTSIDHSEKGEEGFTKIGYVGGPVHTIKFAPNLFEDKKEVFFTLNYKCDVDLITPTWKTDYGFCQFWILSHDSSTKQAGFKPWFILRSERGQILSGTWLDRKKTDSDDKLIGYIALGTVQGCVLIYRISRDCVDTANCEYVPVVYHNPDIILTVENRPNEKVNAGNNSHNLSEVSESYQPPIVRIAWCVQGASQHVCAANAAGEVVSWDLSSSFKEPHILRDPDWGSPAIDVCFQKGYELVVAFRERLVRVYDIRSWECVLEEGTVRTAGSRVMCEPRTFPGLLAFQSEYAASGDVQTTGVAYISTDNQSQGYFVVPLANSHFLQTWDVSISPINGIVASCGADGQLQVAANGKMAANRSIIDCGFSLKKTSFHLTRKRLMKPSDEEKSTNIKESIISHDDICENLWLEMQADVPKDGSLMEYAAIDSRIESLNAVGTNKFENPIVVCGGQAGLIFCRPLHFEGDGHVLGRKYQRS